jgi:hypothetical protein
MDGGQGGCDGVCVDSYAGADEVPDGGAHDCTNGVPDGVTDCCTNAGVCAWNSSHGELVGRFVV